MNDIIGGANLYGGFTIGSKSFTSDRFGYWQSALYLNNANYQMPNGVYFTGDYTFCVWAKMNTINGQIDRIMSIGTSTYTVNTIEYRYTCTFTVHTIEYRYTCTVHTIEYRYWTLVYFTVHTNEYRYTFTLHTIEYVYTCTMYTLHYRQLNIHIGTVTLVQCY